MKVNGIIAKVDVLTLWVSSMVLVEKSNGDIRICSDPKDVSKSVMRTQHKIQTTQDIALKFQGMNYFSIVDMRHWHVPLTHESNLLTSFNTPCGRYCFWRSPFGFKSAAEVSKKSGTVIW